MIWKGIITMKPKFTIFIATSTLPIELQTHYVKDLATPQWINGWLEVYSSFEMEKDLLSGKDN